MLPVCASPAQNERNEPSPQNVVAYIEPNCVCLILPVPIPCFSKLTFTFPSIRHAGGLEEKRNTQMILHHCTVVNITLHKILCIFIFSKSQSLIYVFIYLTSCTLNQLTTDGSLSPIHHLTKKESFCYLF